MDDTQEEYYGMFRKVKLFATTNSAALAINPLIAAEKVKLDNDLNAIDLQDAIANSDDTGFTIMKDNAAEALRERLKDVSKGLTGYFEGTGAAQGLLEKVKMTNSEVEYRDDAKLNTKANVVYLVGNDPAVKTDPLLANYFLVPADIDDLETKRLAFLGFYSLPDEKRGDRVAANKEKARLFDLVNKTLLPRLDNLMLPFETNDTVLYSKYQTAREIDNLPAGSGTDGYNVNTFTVPAGGSVIMPIGDGGPIDPEIQVYLRAINGDVVVCTTALPASPCTMGYDLIKGETFKNRIGNLGLDLTKPNLQLTNPGLSDVLVRGGSKTS